MRGAEPVRCSLSLVALYPATPALDEAGFEAALWPRLQALHALDRAAARLGSDREFPDPASPRVQPEPRRARLLRRRPASGRQPAGAAFRLRGAGVQPAQPVRGAARGWPLRQAARSDHAIATSPSAARATRCWPCTARPPRRASTAAARSAPTWRCPFHPRRRAAEPRHRPRSRSRRAPAWPSMLRRGQRLRVIDPEGEQVADLLAFNRDDVARGAVVRPQPRLRELDLPQHRRRAVLQPQPRDAAHRRRRRRPPRFPAHALLGGDVPHPLRRSAAAPRLLRQPGRGAGALRRRRRMRSRSPSTCS